MSNLNIIRTTLNDVKSSSVKSFKKNGIFYFYNIRIHTNLKFLSYDMRLKTTNQYSLMLLCNDNRALVITFSSLEQYFRYNAIIYLTDIGFSHYKTKHFSLLKDAIALGEDYILNGKDSHWVKEDIEKIGINY